MFSGDEQKYSFRKEIKVIGQDGEKLIKME